MRSLNRRSIASIQILGISQKRTITEARSMAFGCYSSYRWLEGCFSVA